MATGAQSTPGYQVTSEVCAEVWTLTRKRKTKKTPNRNIIYESLDLNSFFKAANSRQRQSWTQRVMQEGCKWEGFVGQRY